MISRARTFFALLGSAAGQAGRDNIARMAAALAYYALFALAPVVFIALALAGVAVGSTQAQARLTTELDLLMGPTLAAAIEGVLGSYRTARESGAAWIGLILLAVGGSGIFLELRASLDAILSRRPPRRANVVRLISLRALAFAMTLLGSVVLLAGMAASVAFQGFLNDAAGLFPQTSAVIEVGGTAALLAISVTAFVLLYRQLPRPKPLWRDAWAGAFVAAPLFCAGEFVMGAYLGRAAPVSPVGAAGSIFAVLIWVFYSAQIVYFGAEFAHACAARRSPATSPSP
jgi:membrane protein